MLIVPACWMKYDCVTMVRAIRLLLSVTCWYLLLFLLLGILSHTDSTEFESSGPEPCEIGSPPVLDSQELHSRFLILIHVLLCLSAFCCSFVSTAFQPSRSIHLQFCYNHHQAKTITQIRKVTACTVAKWSCTHKKSHQFGDSHTSAWGESKKDNEKRKEKRTHGHDFEARSWDPLKGTAIWSPGQAAG